MEDKSIPKKILTYNPRGRRDIDVHSCDGRTSILLKRTERAKYGLILEEAEKMTNACYMFRPSPFHPHQLYYSKNTIYEAPLCLIFSTIMLPPRDGDPSASSRFNDTGYACV
jgi:hypothetical protein